MRGGVQSSSDGYIHHKEIKLAQVSLAIVAGIHIYSNIFDFILVNIHSLSFML